MTPEQNTTEAVERLTAKLRAAGAGLCTEDPSMYFARGLSVKDALDAADIIRALLSERNALVERVKRAEQERDAWKRTAEHHFGHMRAALDLSYAIRWPADPEFLDLIADQIDCGGECETSWREWDTNATGCTKSDSAEGCPFEHACRLRDFAKAMRIHAWTLAFSPPPDARAQAAETKLATLTEALEDAQTTAAFVLRVARLTHSGDEDGGPFDDPAEAEEALDGLIAEARRINTMPLRRVLGEAPTAIAQTQEEKTNG